MKLTFPLALGLLFIGLKLGGVIAWSWLWVLSPFWIGAVVALVFAIGALIALAVLAAFGSRFK